MKRFRLAVLIAIVIFIGLFVFLWLAEGNAEIAKWSTHDQGIRWAWSAEILKVIFPLIAAVMLLLQGFIGNILPTVKTAVLLIGAGVLSLTVGAFWEYFIRLGGIDPGPDSPGTIFFVIGALLVAWALFEFPRRLQANLRKNLQSWFYGLLTIAVVATVWILINSSLKTNLSTTDVIISAVYALLTLIVFAGALRCAMVFSEGKIGRPFLMIAIGGLMVFAYTYIIWLPKTFTFSVFHPIQMLWIGCFIFVSLGAYDLTLSD